jgi:hypothetical protein
MRLSVLLIACFIAWITHEWGDEKPLPDGWFWVSTRTDNATCKAFADKRPTLTSSRPISLECKTNSAGYAVVNFNFPVEKYRGKRVALFADVRTENISDNARLWIRIDDPGQLGVAGDAMGNRPLEGTTDWFLTVVGTDVPSNASSIMGGILLSGSGKISLMRARIQVISADFDLGHSSPPSNSASEAAK